MRLRNFTFGEWVALWVMAAWLFAMAFLSVGCAPTEPYVSTRVLGSWAGSWLNDGPDIAITVGNPTPTPRDVTVLCGNAEPWTVHIPARTETSVIGRVMMRDAWASPCRVRK